MPDDVHWVLGPWAGRLGTVPRPRVGDWLEDEMQRLRGAGVDVLVSLLETAEARDLGLELEASTASAAGITFYALPIVDLGVPASRRDFAESQAPLLQELNQGRNVTVHCRQSVGRSSLVVASLLASAGLSADQAFLQIQGRRVACPCRRPWNSGGGWRVS